MELFEVCRVAPDMIRVELREPALVHNTIRDATAAELQVGGVFEPINIISISDANPAVFTLAKPVPWANNTYVRLSGNPQGKTDLATTGYITAVSGSTFQLYVHNNYSPGFFLYNGAHNPTYVANSSFVTKLSTGTGSSRKYILGMNLDKVKEADYFTGSRGDTDAAMDLSGYTLTGKTLTFVGLQKDVYDVGSTGHSLTTDDERYVASFAYFIYLKASSAIADGSYTLSFPAGLSTSAISFTLNDKTTRCCSIGVNQIGYKPSDESKIGTLCQYVPQYTDYGSMKFLTDYSITDYHLIDSNGTIVWSAGGPPVLRLGNQTAENGGALDSMSADPYAYGVDISGVTPGVTTTIDTIQPHGLVTGDKCTVLYCRGVRKLGADVLYYAGVTSNGTQITATRITDYQVTIDFDTAGATPWLSGGKLTKAYSVNYAGMHTYLLDFSTAVLAEGIYRLYIPNFGVSDPIYMDNAAWARVAAGSMKGLYHQAMGMAKDGRFGVTQQASAKVGVGGVTRINYTPLPHHMWEEQGQGRLSECPGNQRFISGTVNDVWGGYNDAGDWDRVPQMGHLAEQAQMMGPMALVPLASRYTNANFPSSKDTIATADFPRKFFCDWLDAAIWYLDVFRRTQAVDGGIYSAIQMNAGLSSFPNRLGPQPTYETNIGWLVMCPDVASTSQYAYAAALLAWHLREFGDTTLSNLYLASAELAYSYCTTVVALPHEADYHDDARLLYTEQPTTLIDDSPILTFSPHPFGKPPLVSSDGTQWVASDFVGGYAVMNGTTYALRQSGNNFLVYDSTNTTPIDASGFGAYTPDTGKFTPTQAAFRTLWDVRAVVHGFTNANAAKDMAAAAGILYTLTGTAAYKTLHDASNDLAGYRLWGTYIYSLAAGATVERVDAMYTSSATSATAAMITTNGINHRSFSYFYNVGAMQEYGRTVQPVQQFSGVTILSHKKAYAVRRAAPFNETHEQAKAHSSVKQYIKGLQDAYAFLLGSNPIKTCMMIGYGERYPCAMLHIDKQATGSGPYVGITPYWVSTPSRYQISANSYFYAETMLYDAGATTAGGTPNRATELVPHRFARPRMMSYIPSPWMVEHTEFNLSKLYYLIGIALYLQYWEGSAVQADGKKRLIARAA